jgi:transcriptional regulator with XRE-family HTH domain|nr:MAG TPA: Helix-turn-helix XRE-family like protein [Caudoviricetes sp.]
MNTRIKAVRKTLGLTLDKFGERLGISNSACSALETGKNKPSEQTIRAICREFGVNEIWLRTGAGEMFRPEEESEELARNLKRLMNGRPDSLARRAVRVLLRYEPDGPEWQVLEKIYTDVLAEAEKKEPES